MEWLAPWSLAGLALVPAVFLWGLWAPRGRRRLVGSLLLWRRALEAGPAGRPTARMRLKNPLLWLDAGAILLLVLAAARPAVRGTFPRDPVATIRIDRSASMAIEASEGPRWERARAMAEPILREVGRAPVRIVRLPGDTGTPTTEVLSGDEALARGADLWRPTGDLAGGTFQTAPDPDGRPVLVVTDVAPPEAAQGVYVLATGGKSRNVGLVRAALRVEGDRAWLLATVRATADAAGPYSLSLSTGEGGAILREPLASRPSETTEHVLPIPGPLPRELRVALTRGDGRLPLGDDFAADDAAILTCRSERPVRVCVVGVSDAAVEQALAAACGAEVWRPAASDLAVGPEDADVVVAVGAALPAGWTGPAALVMPPAGAGPVALLDETAVAPWTVATAHPLAEAFYLEPPHLEPVRRYRLEPGADLLLGTADVPLAVTWQAGGARRLAVLFPLDDAVTDWTRRAGFPVFWRRAIDWLVPPRSGEGEGEALYVGTGEGFQAGPGRDDSAAALQAVHDSVAARRRAALDEVWPYLAAAALVLVILRGWAAR